ncbi:unnamed protein product, partial [Amoebophrya sp. A120]
GPATPWARQVRRRAGRGRGRGSNACRGKPCGVVSAGPEEAPSKKPAAIGPICKGPRNVCRSYSRRQNSRATFCAAVWKLGCLLGRAKQTQKQGRWRPRRPAPHPAECDGARRRQFGCAAFGRPPLSWAPRSKLRLLGLPARARALGGARFGSFHVPPPPLPFRSRWLVLMRAQAVQGACCFSRRHTDGAPLLLH